MADKEQAPPALNVGSIEDLERRMAAMGSPPKKSPPPSLPQNSAPVAEPVMAKARANVRAPPAMGGKKNPLLARIMAAKEKQQRESDQLPPAAVPPPNTDLLSMDLPPPAATENLPPPALPPPSYETNFSNDMPPPPAFDMVEQKLPPQETEFLPPPPMDDLLPPPPPLNNVLPPPVDLLGMNMPFIPDATAPSFEDLHHMQQQHQPPPAPPPTPQIDESILEALDPAERQAFLEEQRKILEQIESEKSQNEAPAELQIDESILEALDPAERQGFLEEQRKILKQIEKSKPNSTAAKARAFDQRSSSAVANMAAQMESDAEMAARMQREENERTPQRRNRGRGAARESQTNLSDAELAAKLQREENAKQRSRNREQSTSSSGQSWYEWLTGTGTPATNTAAPASPNSIVSRSSPPPARRGLVAAVADESVGLLGSSNSGEAPSESMFSRVASSMKTQMYSLQSDEDGNVHGVDSQGLLAMPDVSRQREN